MPVGDTSLAVTADVVARGLPTSRVTSTTVRDMQLDSGSTVSVWAATADMPQYPPLAEDTEADVCVVGAGIAGMTTAYLLAQAGRRVVVLDDGPIAGGETGRTTAHLSWAIDDFSSEIEKMLMPAGARVAADCDRHRDGNLVTAVR